MLICVDLQILMQTAQINIYFAQVKEGGS